MQKLFLAFICLVVVIAAITNYDRIPLSGADTEINTTATLDFNAYSVGINTVLYDPNGQINYTLQASRQVQYNDDTTEFDKPLIRLFQEGKSKWNVVADSGIISAATIDNNNESRTIELSGNVEVYSLDQNGNRTVMTTDQLSVSPQTETLSTDRPVVVETGAIRQTATGMIANLTTDEIVFHKETRGLYEHPLRQ